MRIHTVTFNPAVDHTITIDRLIPGEVHRARAMRQNAGGKGVNVASCLADWGADVMVHGLLGNDNAAPFDALFSAKGIGDRFIRVAGSTRVNLKLVDDAGTTDINLDGIAVDEALVAKVVSQLNVAVRSGDLVALSGSLPPGCPYDVYAALVAQLRERGCRVLLDTSGGPLKHALNAAVLPHVIKPNRSELAAWTGQAAMDRAGLLSVAADLCRRGVELVVISMGEEGALFVSAQGAVCAHLALDGVASTVGAGDAMVAGLAAALADGLPLERLARLATAFAVGKLGMAGPNLPELGAVRALAQEVSLSAMTMA
ncbi:1-phosphofructokinase [Novosphingobium sp. SG751A]|uniref:1-phosphofructokinase n=1 Tax=Novosphingobium sp. SG751A TaxID=2587000 RepID=UPI001552F2CF|nr:1-phosphofructokinase [Novosphingobium sp. SG751A]NOW45180.1 1-phosphofructokinase [Novosphingobium sp. SG751A]